MFLTYITILPLSYMFGLETANYGKFSTLDETTFRCRHSACMSSLCVVSTPLHMHVCSLSLHSCDSAKSTKRKKKMQKCDNSLHKVV